VVLPTQLDKKGLGYAERANQKNKENKANYKKRRARDDDNTDAATGPGFTISTVYDHPFTNPFSTFGNRSSGITRTDVQQQVNNYYNYAHVFKVPETEPQQYQQSELQKEPQQQPVRTDSDEEKDNNKGSGGWRRLTKLGFVPGGTLASNAISSSKQ
jgi:hypothetical protein